MADATLDQRSDVSQGSRLTWPTKCGIALLWVLTVAALSIDDRNARLYLVTVLTVMAVGGTVIASVAGWRHWRRGLAVEGISLFLARLGLWLVGLAPLLILASLMGALVVLFVGRWRRRERDGEFL